MSDESSVQPDPIEPPHKRFMEAVKGGDIPTLLSLYSDVTVWMPPNEPSLFGKREVEEWHQEYFRDFRITTFEETERDVTVLGGWAIERWAYMVAIQPIAGGDRIRDDGRSFSLWKQEAGVWLMSQSMFNSIRPIGSGTSRFFARLKRGTGHS